MSRVRFLLPLLLAAAGCGRSGLEFGDARPFDAALDEEKDDERQDARVEIEDPCVPRDEVCDGVDNDCDGQVDEGLPAEPCPNGGARYCVGGVYSDCPRACAVCQPGSRRVCFLTYCTIWGEQQCESDGRAWRRCREEEAPEPCKSSENAFGGAADDPETEQCCIDQGYCCQDYWDLDGDGDTDEMVGECDGVSCG